MPAAVDVTLALSVVVPPIVAELGFTVTLVVVAGCGNTVRVVVPLEAPKSEFWAKLAVIVSTPTVNPFWVFTVSVMVDAPPETKRSSKTKPVLVFRVTYPFGSAEPGAVKVTVKLAGLFNITEAGATVTEAVVGIAVTCKEVVPLEAAKLVSPLYIAVIEFVPGGSQLAELAVMESVAMPLKSWAVPNIELKAVVLNVMVPLGVPAAVDVTVAVNVVVPPAVNELGEAETAVVVAGNGSTVRVVVPLEEA